MKNPLFILLTLLSLPAAALSAKDKWTPLFDGKTTAGWTPRGEVVSFVAVDGELRILSKTNVWIVTDRVLGDFVLEAEVKLPEDAAETGFNSGLAFRCTGGTGKPKGYQCEIDLGKPGGVYGIGLGGWLYPAQGEEAQYKSRIADHWKPLEWNQLRVVCLGPHIQTYVNGALIADLEDSQSLSGYFGIQHHGKGGLVRFRNLRVKSLPVAD